MDYTSSSEQMGEAMERARRHWQAGLKAEAAIGMPVSRSPVAVTVAISREAGSNGALIAAQLGERLNWPVYDRKLLERISEEMGLRASLLASVDEKRVSWVRECLGSFSSAPAVSSSAYVHRLIEIVFSLAAHGECVIVGRGAAQMLPPATTLRVYLLAPRPARVRVVKERLGLSEAEALRWIETTDQERSRFVREYFHKDPADPHGYDLVLNTTRLPIEESAAIIEEMLCRFRAGLAKVAAAGAGVSHG
jgi:cytidylate kinase